MTLSKISLDVLEDYRRSRRIGLVTWKVELQAIRTFLGYCVSHKWLPSNPAKELKPPRNLKPNEIVPYTLQEESRILSACYQIGGGKYHRSGASYEQLRARAMLLLLRHTALRIIALSQTRYQGYLSLRSQVTKSYKLIYHGLTRMTRSARASGHQYRGSEVILRLTQSVASI